MSFERGDVIYLDFLIPGNSRFENHPALIISNANVFDADEIYHCVMITHSELNSMFSFELRDEMFNKYPIPEGSIKAHLIAYVQERHINSRVINHMKKLPIFIFLLIKSLIVLVRIS